MATLGRIDGLVFDVYGTLCDVQSVVAACEALGPGGAALLATWRAKQLEYSWLRTLMGHYADFWQITHDALGYAAERHGVPLDTGRRTQLLDAWFAVAPYPDSEDALRQFQAAGRTLAILSNGSPLMLERLLANTGLGRYFAPGQVLSVDAARAFKPDPRVYALVPAALGSPPERLLFVSSNGFDVAGAKAFGFRVARIDRAGAPAERLGLPPDLTVANLGELAASLA